MHASVGGEVQSNPVSSVLAAQLSAGAQDAGSQDLGDLVETLSGGHEIRRQGVGAGQAAVGIVASIAGLHAHAAARSRLLGLASGRSA